MTENEAKIASFRQKQEQSYEFKVAYAEQRALEFYHHPEVAGHAYVAVGGLDSITLFLFLRKLGINVPGVSVSYLEDKSIQTVHRALGIVGLKSSTKPGGGNWSKIDVIKTYGFPVLSKELAQNIEQLQNYKTASPNTINTLLHPNTQGYHTAKISRRWLKKFGGCCPEGADLGFQAAPFCVSAKCCELLKEKPCNDYAKETGRYPYMGLLASEGGRREIALMLHGCNYISSGTKRSCPFAIFSRHDMLRLALEMDSWYQDHWQEFSDTHLNTIVPAIYGVIQQQPDGSLETTGAKRTGCSMCGFGIHIEPRPHRFDKLRERNEKEWDFWMNQVGWGQVLDYIGVEWRNKPTSLVNRHNIFQIFAPYLPQSDLTDAQWESIDAVLSSDTTKCLVDRRNLMNGILHKCRSGKQWRSIPRDLYGPWKTCYKWFQIWTDNGNLEKAFMILKEEMSNE